MRTITVDTLRAGVVVSPSLTGDGSHIDTPATEAAMHEAADRIEALEAELAATDAIIGRLREIINGGIEAKPGYQTDREIYGQMHGQVLRLLECDAPRRAHVERS